MRILMYVETQQYSKKSLDEGIINKNRKHYKQVIKYTTLNLLRRSQHVLRGLCAILSAYFNKKEPKN